MEFGRLLAIAVKHRATDLVVKTDAPPRYRINGELVPVPNWEAISADTMGQWMGQILPKRLHQILSDYGDVDFGFQSHDGTRFRVNLFRQRQVYGMALRIISKKIYLPEELMLPKVIGKLAYEKRGLVLVTGATGNGKSTTLAAIVQKINRERNAHIITIEDPIEFDFSDERSTVNQREIGIDVPSFSGALRSALRQNPDVILVGELRDKETIETALMAAETGHLVMSTLHTTDSVDTLSRLLAYFPPHQHKSVRIQLASALKAVVSQRLVRRMDKRGMVPAIEIMIANGFVQDIILKGDDFEAIYDAISKGKDIYGMQSFDQSIIKLFESGLISRKEALRQATKPGDLELIMNGIGA